MAGNELRGSRVLVIVSNHGVEQDELLVPVRRLRADGVEVDVAAITADPIATLVRDRDPGETVEPTRTLTDTDPSAYDLLLIPGGTLNADALRTDAAALTTVRAFTSSSRPVASICHGPWVLVEADAVDGKKLTSYLSLHTDIRNAGGTWVDEPVVVDASGGWTLITSRNPDDLDPFLREVSAALTIGSR